MTRSNSPDAFRLAVFAAWAVYTLVFAWYAIGSNDEGGYHNVSIRMAAGEIPILDFFVIQGLWSNVPHGIVAALVSPSIEAMRTLSAAFLIAGVAMTVALARRHIGQREADVVFFLLACSTVWLTASTEVRHSTVVNIALVSTVYCLFSSDRIGIGRAFVAGALFAVAVNARVVLVPLLVVGGVAIWFFVLRKQSRPLTLGAAAVLGVLLVSLPNLVLCALDPERFFYNYLVAPIEARSTDQYSAVDTVELVFYLVSTRLHAVVEFLGFTARLDRYSLVQNLAIFAALAWVAAMAVRAPERTKAALAGVLAQPLFRVCTTFVLLIWFCYSLADKVPGYYFNHTLPFLFLLFAASVRRIRAEAPWRTAAAAVMIAAAGLYGAWYAAVTGTEIIRRAEPSRARPLVIAEVACWLEAHAGPDDRILSFRASPVAAAGLRLPEGFEQGHGMIAIHWFRTEADVAERMNVLLWNDVLARLRDGSIAIVVDDGILAAVLETQGRDAEARDMAEIMATKFVRVGTTGGAFPYTVYLTTERVGTTVHTLAPPERLSVDAAFVADHLSSGAFGELLRAGLSDLGRSLAMLPSDLRGSASRALGLTFQQRCEGLLGPPKTVAAVNAAAGRRP